jgi:regulator of RNase E activity RraA
MATPSTSVYNSNRPGIAAAELSSDILDGICLVLCGRRDGAYPQDMTTPSLNGRAAGIVASPNDLELFAHMEANLYTAVVADSLDELGYYNQAMREHLRPATSKSTFAGRARTITCMDVFHDVAEPYAMEIEAVDSILDGEVVVVAAGNSKRNAPWGELLSTAALARGARGAVVDGLIRDVRKIEQLGFPVFAAGIKPVDARGRGVVFDYNLTSECGGVVVCPGDVVFADYDGVVVIPAAAVSETIQRATDKVARENGSRADLMKGAYLRDVFAKYGVL